MCQCTPRRLHGPPFLRVVLSLENLTRSLSRLIGIPALLIAVAKSYLHQRQYSIVALLRTLKDQQIIIRAARASRELATHRRASLVDGATTGYRIEKLAGLSENRISLAAQDLLALPRRRETTLRGFIVDAKIVGQPADITPGHLHALVNGATVRGAFRTVVVAHGCCLFSYRPGLVLRSPIIVPQ